MFNLKILANLGEASVETLAHNFFVTKSYQPSLCEGQSIGDIVDLIGQNLSQLKLAGRDDLIAAYKRFTFPHWDVISNKNPENQRAIEEKVWAGRLLHGAPVELYEKRQNILRKQVEDLKKEIADQVIFFLRNSPGDIFVGFSSLRFELYESIWRPLYEESEHDTYTKSNFGDFLDSIPTYKQSIGSTYIPPLEPELYVDGGSEGFNFSNKTVKIAKTYLKNFFGIGE